MKAVQSTEGRKLTSFVKPMLAELSKKPVFDHPEWLFEIKWDGYRAIAETTKKQIRLYSRNGLSFSNRYPALIKALEKLKDKVILDGEIVVLNADNRSDFQYLQNFERDKKGQLCFYVFDILELNGKDVKNLPLLVRKNILKATIPSNGIVRYSDHVEENGVALFREVTRLNLEGIIAKQSGSIYQPGKRTSSWLKIKNVNAEEAVIIGFTPPKGSRLGFGSLLLGQYKGKTLQYIGNVGTGFSDAVLKDLTRRLRQIEVQKMPLQKVTVKPPASTTWVKPKLVCQIKYTEKTRDGLVRHPVFQGLRVDKSSKEVKLEL